MNFNTFLIQADAGAGAPGGSNMSFILVMVAVFAIMYLFMIRPQQKRQKELVNFRNSLQKGDKVMTAGGIYGKIKEMEDQVVTIEIDNNVNIKVDKTMITRDPSSAPTKK